MARVLITGAGGFVGLELAQALARAGHIVRGAVRSSTPALPAAVSERVQIGDIGGTTDWSLALENVDAVVHLAARTHHLNDGEAQAPLYFETNVDGTRTLAKAAVSMGVRRFVFVSSIKVNGEHTAGSAFTAADVPRPCDAYGRSKLEAERLLQEMARETRMEIAIVRPPLVYGPHVRGNFRRLLGLVARGIPVPLGAVDNRRSLVSVWALCDFLRIAVEHPRAAGGIWMITDGEDLSTPELLRRIAKGMQRSIRLPRVPLGLLESAAALLGRSAEFARLCGSLQVDITVTQRELGWISPLTVDAAIARTVDWYLEDAACRSPLR